MGARLKPCPFCGEMPVEIEALMVDFNIKTGESTYRDRVECITESCILFEEKIFLDNWNTRSDKWNDSYSKQLEVLSNAVRIEIRKSGGNLRLEEAMARAGLAT